MDGWIILSSTTAIAAASAIALGLYVTAKGGCFKARGKLQLHTLYAEGEIESSPCTQTTNAVQSNPAAAFVSATDKLEDIAAPIGRRAGLVDVS
jgi:hypothetical protein